jgi:hypothetical protein
MARNKVEALTGLTPGFCVFLYDPQCLRDGLHGIESPSEFLPRMGCSDNGADTRLAHRNGGIADALGKDARLEKLAGELVSQRRVTHDDGCDRRFAHSGIEAKLLEAVLEESGVLP